MRELDARDSRKGRALRQRVCRCRNVVDVLAWPRMSEVLSVPPGSTFCVYARLTRLRQRGRDLMQTVDQEGSRLGWGCLVHGLAQESNRRQERKGWALNAGGRTAQRAGGRSKRRGRNYVRDALLTTRCSGFVECEQHASASKGAESVIFLDGEAGAPHRANVCATIVAGQKPEGQQKNQQAGTVTDVARVPSTRSASAHCEWQNGASTGVAEETSDAGVLLPAPQRHTRQVTRHQWPLTSTNRTPPPHWPWPELGWTGRNGHA